MRTILYQGRPAKSDKWLALPEGLAATYKDMGYGLRELVLREEAEQAKVEHFNTAIELAALAAEQACLVPPDGGSPTEAERAVADEAAKRIRALKIEQQQKGGAA